NDQDRNKLKVNKEWLDNINITERPSASLCNSPNICHEEIIDAVDRAWPKLNKCVYEIQLPPKTEILELLKIVLQNDIFEFHGNIFRQRVGIPMGLAAAPWLTDLRMFEIISDILNRFQYSKDILMISIYGDDVFIIFNKSERHFMEFIKIANSIHPLIKFTHTISNTEIQFLDVTIYNGKRFLEDNILDVKLHRKPTDNFQYLDKSFSHPNAVFKGFIIGETIRIIRSSNNEIDRQQEIDLFKNKLTQRGSEESEIEPIIKGTLKRSKHGTLIYEKKKTRKAPPLVLTTRVIYTNQFKNAVFIG
ncbi:Hypothetical predicted protein, partial [Mytilus galloprovincialis]